MSVESYVVSTLPAQVLLPALLRCEQEVTPKATYMEFSPAMPFPA